MPPSRCWFYFLSIHAFTKAAQTPVKNQLVTPLDISDYVMKLPPGKDKAGGGGGGRERAQLPPTRGKLPEMEHDGNIALRWCTQNPSRK